MSSHHLHSKSTFVAWQDKHDLVVENPFIQEQLRRLGSIAILCLVVGLSSHPDASS